MMLKVNREDRKVVQESLRHADSRVTLDAYAQAVTPAKRAAQRKVVEQLVICGQNLPPFGPAQNAANLVSA
jgi:integrase